MTDPILQTRHEASPVVVWGGGSGGVAAALQAARAGAETLLLTPGPWLGGMVSAAGVCAPDGNELSPWQSGIWGALLRALAEQEPEGLDQNWVSCFGYRPATAESILRGWVAAEPHLCWWPGCGLREVRRSADRIDAVVVERAGVPITVRPEVVIDGSDRGDLLAMAGAPFRLGWEPRELWGEPSAPPRADLESLPFFRQQPVQSPTWVAMGQLKGDAPAAPLAADPPLPPPFTGAATAFGLEKTLTYGRLPGGLVMLNWPLRGNDWHGGLERAFGGDPAAEASLLEEMRAHSERFARVLEEASGGWLEPGAVFPSEGEAAAGSLRGQRALALMPYWREGRRLIGRETVREQHLLPQAAGACTALLPLDATGAFSGVAVGNYANDHHYPGLDWPLAPKSCRWGGRWSGTPFCIPFGALVCDGIANLLAADKCLSVSHMANGATRLQPLVLNIGQAAGMAAALSLQRGLALSALPVRELQEALLREPTAPAGAVPLWDTPWHHPLWRQRQRRVIDDPSLLSPQGTLAGADLDPHQAPAERLEQAWSGTLTGDGGRGFQLESGDCRWPLITLEPALHGWLLAEDRPREVSLIGCRNPWGPWLRISRLA